MEQPKHDNQPEHSRREAAEYLGLGMTASPEDVERVLKVELLGLLPEEVSALLGLDSLSASEATGAYLSRREHANALREDWVASITDTGQLLLGDVDEVKSLGGESVGGKNVGAHVLGSMSVRQRHVEEKSHIDNEELDWPTVELAYAAILLGIHPTSSLEDIRATIIDRTMGFNRESDIGLVYRFLEIPDHYVQQENIPQLETKTDL